MGRCPTNQRDPSRCPTVEDPMRVDECESDIECGGESKCCSDGCRRLCVLPILTCEYILYFLFIRPFSPPLGIIASPPFLLKNSLQSLLFLLLLLRLPFSLPLWSGCGYTRKSGTRVQQLNKSRPTFSYYSLISFL